VSDLRAPVHTVEGFIFDFMRELNYGQGVSLVRSSKNDQKPGRAHRSR
jgi:starch phosphorylase